MRPAGYYGDQSKLLLLLLILITGIQFVSLFCNKGKRSYLIYCSRTVKQSCFNAAKIGFSIDPADTHIRCSVHNWRWYIFSCGHVLDHLSGQIRMFFPRVSCLKNFIIWKNYTLHMAQQRPLRLPAFVPFTIVPAHLPPPAHLTWRRMRPLLMPSAIGWSIISTACAFADIETLGATNVKYGIKFQVSELVQSKVLRLFIYFTRFQLHQPWAPNDTEISNIIVAINLIYC